MTPEVRGNPVALVNTKALGVPKAGVTRVGELLKTTLPVPVLEVTPVPPLATGKVPVTPVDKGRPVAFVKTKDEGVQTIPASLKPARYTILYRPGFGNSVTT